MSQKARLSITVGTSDDTRWNYSGNVMIFDGSF